VGRNDGTIEVYSYDVSMLTVLSIFKTAAKVFAGIVRFARIAKRKMIANSETLVLRIA